MSEYDGISDEIRMCLDPASAAIALKLIQKSFSLEGTLKRATEDGKKASSSLKRSLKTVDRLLEENEYLRKSLRSIRDEKPDSYEIRFRIDEALEYVAIKLPEEL